MLRDSDRALLVWDGKSKGTSNELEMCVRFKVPHTLYRLEPSKHKASVGFEAGEDGTDWANVLG